MSAEPRFATPRNIDRRTLGGEVGEVMAALGTPPMPWQQQVLDVAYELDEDATEEASSAAGEFRPRLWYREPRVTVERQAGKTQKALGRHLHRQQKSRVYGWNPRPTSIYMAQTASDAREKMVEEWFPVLEDSPYDTEAAEVDGVLRVRQYLRANGKEAIKFFGGGRIVTKPPTRTGGHGVSATALVDLDEAFAHRDATAEQGVRPSMITSVSPQLWIVSTAGTAESEYLWGKVDDGRSRCETGEYGRVCYFEWSFPEDCDPADERVWCDYHPAIGYTIDLDALRAEFDSMDLDEFKRAYGNMWTATVKRLVPADAWAGCLNPSSEIVGEMFLTADAAPGAGSGRSTSIAVGGWNLQGKSHAEVIDSAPGLSWVAKRIGDLTRKWRRIQKLYLDPTGPIGSIVPDIERESAVGIEYIDARTMAAACGRHLDDILSGDFVHIGQDVLDRAVDGAAKRTLLDSWAWARRNSASDISPLVAVTEAHWATVTNPPNESRIF